MGGYLSKPLQNTFLKTQMQLIQHNIGHMIADACNI